MAETAQNEKSLHSLDRYTCSICFEYLRKPILTRCGHKFCQSCIDTWLKTQPNCPTCKDDLKINVDTFPDKFTEREILGLRIDCPNAQNGCSIKSLICDLEEHAKMCMFSLTNEVEGELLCQYASVGCKQVFKCTEELEDHLKKFYESHLKIVTDALNKLKMDTFYNDKLLKQQKAHLEELNSEFNKFISWPISQLFYNGHLLWNIDDITDKFKKGFNLRSPVFYSSRIGYKLAVLCKSDSSCTKPSWFSIKIVLLSSDNDINLKWPCKIKHASISILQTFDENEYDNVLVERKNIAISRPLNVGESVVSKDIHYPVATLSKNILDDKLWIKAHIELDD